MAWLNIVTAKACISLGMFCGTMLFASIPVLLSRRSYRNQRAVRHALTGLSCLGGGVFLATCFLHLIPEATEEMEHALKHYKIETTFPVAYAVIIIGFLLVLITEQIIHSFHGSGHGHSHGPPIEEEDDEANAPAPVPNYGAIRRDEQFNADIEPADDNQAARTENDSDDEDRMTVVSVHGDPGSHSAFRVVVMVFALSLHSIFEGLAIGLQQSTQSVVQLFGAIMVHKGVIAVTLGTSLVSTSSRLGCTPVFIALFVFSFMTPLGIMIAIAIGSTSPMVNGVLQCIAAGTFVYITFFEILPHELNSKHTKGSRLYRVLMMILGIALMVGILLAFPDEDGHGHGHGH